MRMRKNSIHILLKTTGSEKQLLLRKCPEKYPHLLPEERQ